MTKSDWSGELESPAVRRLACGCPLYVLERPEHQLAVLQVAFACGSVSEAEAPGYGLAHFTEHMLFNGCAGFPGNAVSRKLRQAGGECNAATGFDTTRYWMELPAENVGLAVRMLSAMVTHPAFPEASCRKERSVIQREAEMYRDQPGSAVAQGLWELLFAGHPARFPIAGLPERIARITPERLRAFHRRFYTPDRAVWVAAGRVDPGRLAAALDQALSGWAPGTQEALLLPNLPRPGIPLREVRTFADPLARLAIGVRLPPVPSPEMPALDLLSGILAQDESSRMVRALQQRRPLALSLGSAGYAGSFGGELGITATCRPADLEPLEAGIRKILQEFQQHGVTAAELRREKLQQELDFRQSWQSAREAVSQLASGVLNCGSFSAWQAYRKRLAALPLEAVNAAAAEYLREERLAAMILRPETPPAKPVSTPTARQSSRCLPDSGKTREGIRFHLLPTDRSGLQDLQILLPLGSLAETPADNGAAALLAELLETGPATLAEARFHTQMDDAGIAFSARAGKSSLLLALNFPAAAAKTARTMLAELLLHPRITAAAVRRKRAELAALLTGYAADPQYAAGARMNQLLFGGHPAALPRLGTPESLSRLTPATLQNRYQQAWQPERIRLGATLPDTPAQRQEWTAFFRDLSRRLPRASRPLPPCPPLPPLAAERFAELHLPKEQSTVLCGMRGPSAHAPLTERLALQLLQQALNGLDSPLFREIREKRSLAYATGFSQAVGSAHGILLFYAGTAPERAAEAAQAIAATCRRLQQRGLTQSEFAAAKLALAGADARRKESAAASLSQLLTVDFLELPAAEALDRESLLKRLTFAAANAAIRRLCAADLCTVIVTPQPSCHQPLPTNHRKA